MKKVISLFVLIFFFSAQLFAQPGNTGLRFSHFGGTMSTYENPAFGAANDTKWEVQLFNVNEMFESDKLALNWNSVLNNGVLFDSNRADRKRQTQQGVNDFSFRNVLELAGPAVYFNYKKKFAFGINTRTRFFFQLNDANLNLAQSVFNESNLNVNDYGAIQEDYLNTNLNVMTDIGFTGSAQVLSLKKHKLFVGASLRFYKGLASLDFTGRNIDIDPDKIANSDSVVEFSSDLEFNSSVPTDFDILSSTGSSLSFGSVLSNAFNRSAGKGVGGDIGAVYQGIILNRSLRASLSITDIGSINYNRGRQRSASFVANKVQIPIDSFSTFPSGYVSIRKWSADYGVQIDTGSNSYTHSLPTRLNLYGELQVLKGFHVGLAASANLANTNKIHSSYSGYTSIIPRWQSRMLEAWLPMTYNYFSRNVKAGLGFRLAYFYFGSDDVLSLARRDVKSLNFYAGLRIAGNYSKRKVKKAERK